MSEVQKPSQPEPGEQIDVGEKTLVGEDLEREQPAVEEEPIKVPDVVDASLKIICGGTVGNFKLKRDQITTTIGSVREDCDMYVNDSRIGNRQLAIIQMGQDFVLADCGVQDIVTFDGIPTRQTICPPGTRCVVHMGKTTVIFSSKTKRKPAPGQEPSKRFHLEMQPTPELYPGGELKLVHAKKTYTTSLEPIILGSHGECDLHLHGDEIRPFHALAHWRADGLYIMPLGAGPVRINDTRIEEATILAPGDTIAIGAQTIQFDQSGDIQGRGEAMFGGGKAHYDYIRFSAVGNSVSGSFMIPAVGPAIMVGRSPSCHITIEDGACSREHAQIIPNGKSCQLIDNYSANGCYVNDEKVSKVRVRAGDLVEIGRSIFVVHYD